jgi:hypothetical protein
MKKFAFLFLFLFTIISTSYSTTNTATTGSWNTNTTWSLNRQPQGGDTIIIPTSIIVNNIPSNLTISGSPVVIIIYGTVDFGNSGKLKLPAGSIVDIKTGGSIIAGSGNGSNNIIDIGNVEVWKASCGNITVPIRLDGTLDSDVLCTSLALELICFNVLHQDNHVQINFVIVNNNNINTLSIQKSYDLENWERVHIWYNPKEQNFNYYDGLQLDKKYTYYRLEQIENNGEVFYSNIKAVSNTNFKSVDYYVIDNKIQFIFLSDETDVYVFDIHGRMIANICKNAELHVENGIYILKINSNLGDKILYDKIMINGK